MESMSIHAIVPTLDLRESIVISTLMNVRSTEILVNTMQHALILSINTNANVILVMMESIVKEIYLNVRKALAKMADYAMKNPYWIIIVRWTTYPMK